MPALQALYDEQRRSANFKIEAERSKWVNKEIKAAEKAVPCAKSCK